MVFGYVGEVLLFWRYLGGSMGRGRFGGSITRLMGGRLSIRLRGPRFGNQVFRFIGHKGRKGIVIRTIQA